jgi:hypothetical protein
MRKLTALVISSLILSQAGFAKSTQQGNVVCDQPYALCTTATCVPMPGTKDKALCFCNIFSGASYGTTSCEHRKPSVDSHNNHYLFSTFSFEDYATNAMMTCPAGTPWTFCLDKPCQVDPRNSNQAICSCDIIRTGEYITLGGECNTSTCGNTLYSGASVADIKQAAQILLKKLNLKKSPIRICPVKADNHP